MNSARHSRARATTPALDFSCVGSLRSAASVGAQYGFGDVRGEMRRQSLGDGNVRAIDVFWYEHDVTGLAFIGEGGRVLAKDETSVVAEPLWFRAVAAQCRQKAAAYAPNHGDTAASMADLDHAVDAALYAWYFHSCHRNSIIHKYEHKDDPPPEEAAVEAADKPAGEL